MAPQVSFFLGLGGSYGLSLTLQNTVAAGIVSCGDCKSSDLGQGVFRREYLQTVCAVDEGNSGGPLLNVYGEIVDVNIMKVLGADGLNFAVPVDSVSSITEHFKRNGRVKFHFSSLELTLSGTDGNSESMVFSLFSH